MTLEDVEKIIDFVMDSNQNGSPDYCNSYIAALEILGEDCVDNWTRFDVIETIQRALLIKH